MNMIKRLTTLAAAALFSLPGIAAAHPEHDDAPPPKTQDAEVKASVVASKTGATVRLNKGGMDVSTKGANGTLTLGDGDSKTVLPLKTASGNTLTAKSKTAIAAGTRAQVSVNLADKSTVAAETTTR